MTDEKTPYLIGMTGLLLVITMLLIVSISKPFEARPTINVKASTEDVRNTLTVSGNSQLTVPPDRAIAYVSIITENDAAKVTQDENRRIDEAVMKALKGWGAKDSDIETDSYSLSRIQEWDSEKERYVEKGYRLTHTLKVTTLRITELGGLIDKTVEAGANGVDRITFDLTKETEKKVRDEALLKATEVATEKARNLAESAGVTLGRVYSVNEQNFYYTPFEYANVKMDASAGYSAAPTQISPQKVEITSSVGIVYEIK